MCIWNTYPLKHQKTLSGTFECGETIDSVLWTKDKQIIVGCRDGTINILDILENSFDDTGLFLFKKLKEEVILYRDFTCTSLNFFPPQYPIRSLFWDEATQYLVSVNQNHSMNVILRL